MVSNLITGGLVPAVKQTYNITLNDIKGNSVALANSIKDGTLTGDLFMSADASVNQTLMGSANDNWVDWFTVFARNEVVLAYSPTGKFAADFQQKPWYQVLEEGGVKLGRDDPNLDPLGYYDLFVAQLAEKFYRIPGLKQQILGADNNPNQIINTNPTLLSNGTLDAEFMYINKAQDAGVPYVTFPDQLNLSNPDLASYYAQASYTTNIGQTFRGAPIQVSIAPLRNGNTKAADEVIQLLDSHRRVPPCYASSTSCPARSWPAATSTPYPSASDARSRAPTKPPDQASPPRGSAPSGASVGRSWRRAGPGRTAMVDRPTHAGLVRRTPDPHGRRRVALSITTAAQPIIGNSTPDSAP